MTDGIIQQVCKKFIENNNLPYIAKTVSYQIEQELIEKIKQTIPNSCSKFANAGGDIFYTDGEEEILKLLIGDNQE